MYLATLSLTEFRAFHSLNLTFPPQGALVQGLNGSGKTNLLEAVHLLCTGRSQREALRAEMINFDAQACRLEGEFQSPDDAPPRRAAIGFDRDKRISMTSDDRSVPSLSAWIGVTAAISFGPDDLKLVWGPPAQRRRFLDMLISQIDPSYLESLIAYRTVLLNRNKLLALSIDDAQLSVFDERMAGFGAILARKRREIAQFISPRLEELYREISGGRERGSAEFCPSPGGDFGTEEEWKNVFLEKVQGARKRDLALGFSSIGPHRDELVFRINGRPARNYGSQGQCRSLALALRLCSVLCTEHFTHQKMVFLVDDALSELDEHRIGRVLPLLENRGQLFVATPTPISLSIALPRFTAGDNTVVVA